MALIFYFICILIPFCVLALDKEFTPLHANMERLPPKDGQTNRDGKLFSLFSIVQFKNEACRSTQTLSNTGSTVARNGTCYSSTECQDKSGQAAGGCAAGFGICCVFVYEAGGTLNQNCSYIRNPNYPNAATDTASLSYTVQKCDPSVCYLRLDFESFDINGLSASTENTAALATTLIDCQDKFTITSTNDPNMPVICGKNTGQHVYVDVGTGASDTATLQFDFTDNAALTNSRYYEVKVTQLPCNNEYNRFPGCFQYHEGLTGRVETFNYQNCALDGTQTHLPNQDYSICVRPESGYDCVQWQICPDQLCGNAGTAGSGITLPAVGAETGQEPCVAFSIGTIEANAAKAQKTSDCVGDYISIDGASPTCCQGSNPIPTQDRFCGWWFYIDPLRLAGGNIPLCDCTAPYSLNIKFDGLSDIPAGTNLKTSCGLCLEYKQVRC